MMKNRKLILIVLSGIIAIILLGACVLFIQATPASQEQAKKIAELKFDEVNWELMKKWVKDGEIKGKENKTKLRAGVSGYVVSRRAVAVHVQDFYLRLWFPQLCQPR